MSVATSKVPTVIVSSFVCLLLGVGIGVAVMGTMGDKFNRPANATPDAGAAAADPNAGDGKGVPAGMPPMGGMAGAKGGAKGGGMGGMGRGPSAKTQLAQLVSKLDVLTKKPLAVQLTAEQKQQAKEILAGIDEKDDLSDEDAKAKLDALLKLVEGQKETLEAAGYRWPGAPGGGGFGGGAPGGPGGGPPPPNPFKAGDNGERLKSLRGTLEQ